MSNFTIIVNGLPDDLKKLAMELYEEGALTTGAHYRWPRNSGGYLDVIGGGLYMYQGKPKLVGCHNSAIAGGAKITLLDLDLPLRMIAQGEVQYLGNFLNPAYRKTVDMEKFSLAIMGLIATIHTIKEHRKVSVDEILEQLDSGKMTLDDLMKKAGLNTEMPLEEMSPSNEIMSIPPHILMP